MKRPVCLLLLALLLGCREPQTDNPATISTTTSTTISATTSDVFLTLRNSEWIHGAGPVHYRFDNNYKFYFFNADTNVEWAWDDGFPPPNGFSHFRDISWYQADGFAYGVAADMYHFSYVEFNLLTGFGISNNFRIFKNNDLPAVYSAVLTRINND